MLGSVLALTVRALRVDARSWLPHLVRLAFVLYLLGTLIFAQMESVRLAAPGLWVFNSVCWANFVLILMGGVSVFAVAITEEKEEETLGLLRMAGVNPAGLLLGKSTTRLITALVILAVQFPFTLLAITLGGVVWPQIIAAYVTLAGWLFCVANLALLASVVCPRSPSAAAMAGMCVGLWMVGPWISTAILSALNRYYGLDLFGLDELLSWLAREGILSRLYEILGSSFAEDPWSWGLLNDVLLGLFSFALAWISFDWFTRDHLTASPGRGGMGTRRRIRRPAPFETVGVPAAAVGRSTTTVIPAPAPALLPALLRGNSPSPAWKNALIWKDFYFLGGGPRMMLGKFVGYALIMALILFVTMWMGPGWPQDWTFFRQAVGAASFYLGLIYAGVELTLFASRVFWEETRWHTWSSLVMLPHSLHYIAYSKVAGVFLTTLPAFSWILFGAMLNLDTIVEVTFSPHNRAEWVVQFILGVMIGISAYLLFLHLVVYLSLWLKWGALVAALALYNLGWCTTVSCCGAAFSRTSTGGPESSAVLLFCWLAVMVALNVGLHVAIGHRLHQLSQT